MNKDDFDLRQQEVKRQRVEIEKTIDLMNREVQRERIRKGLKLTTYLNTFQAEFNKMNLELKKATIQYIFSYLDTFDDLYIEAKNEITCTISNYKVSLDEKNISNVNWSFLTNYFDVPYIADLLLIMKEHNY